jgi:hypothetical protein
MIGALTVGKSGAGDRAEAAGRGLCVCAAIGALRATGMGFEPAARASMIYPSGNNGRSKFSRRWRVAPHPDPDEPTSVLAPEERAGLFAMMARLKERGTGIILISHRLEDILETCDRVTVMRQGRMVGGGAVVGLTRADLVRMVVGNELPTIEHRASASGPLVLVVEGLTLRARTARPRSRVRASAARRRDHPRSAAWTATDKSELIELIAGMLAPQAGN